MSSGLATLATLLANLKQRLDILDLNSVAILIKGAKLARDNRLMELRVHITAFVWHFVSSVMCRAIFVSSHPHAAAPMATWADGHWIFILWFYLVRATVGQFRTRMSQNKIIVL